MLDGSVQTELEEVLTLGRWRVGTHLQTQRCSPAALVRQTNWNDRFWISLRLIYLLGHSAASRVRRRSDEQGSEVRGRVGEQGRGCRGGHTVCWHIWVPRLPFPSPQRLWIIWQDEEDGSAPHWGALKSEGQRGKEATRWIWGMQSSHRWACRADWGRWVCMLKMSSPLPPPTALRDHSGLEPNHNKTQRHTDI